MTEQTLEGLLPCKERQRPRLPDGCRLQVTTMWQEVREARLETKEPTSVEVDTAMLRIS
jgi:hypothetical protein